MINRSEIRSTRPRIGEGTARVVYDLGAGRCVKFAKGERGRLQNATEADVSNCYPALVANTYECPEDFSYLIVEQRARPAVVADLKQHFGVKSWRAFKDLFFYDDDIRNGVHRFTKDVKARLLWDGLWEHERGCELLSMVGNYDLAPGDIGRRCSWGIFPDGSMKLVDAGATNDLISSHY
jgi:hypothetical protein